MRLVIVESPFAGRGATLAERDRAAAENLRYLRACLADSLRRGEAPFASHGLYTQPGVLDDADAVERAHGIAAGFAWRSAAHATVVYTDRGMSSGMRAGIEHAATIAGHVVEYRTLGGEWAS